MCVRQTRGKRVYACVVNLQLGCDSMPPSVRYSCKYVDFDRVFLQGGVLMPSVLGVSDTLFVSPASTA